MYEDEKLDEVLAPMRPDNLHDGYGFVIEVGDGRVYKIPFHILDDPGFFLVDLEVNNISFTLEIRHMGDNINYSHFQITILFYLEPPKVFRLDNADVCHNTPYPFLDRHVLNSLVNQVKNYVSSYELRDIKEYVIESDVDLILNDTSYLVQDTRGLEALNPPEEPEEDQEVTEIDSAWDLF